MTDLLRPGGPLDVREAGQRAVVIAGLSQPTPDGPDHLMAILEAGNRNRTQHPTDMNAESSRSHAVFQVNTGIVRAENGVEVGEFLTGRFSLGWYRFL